MMSTSGERGRPNARQTILAAADRLVHREGATHLTLEAVAREAGVSKGGLLYHFGTKEALVRGMLAAYFAEFEADIERCMADEAAGGNPDAAPAGAPAAGRWTRAYARATFFPSDTATLSPAENAAILATLAAAPELLAELRARSAAWQRRAERDGIDPTRATLVRLAADGLLFAEMLDLAPPDPEQRERVLALLLDLTRQGGE